MRPCWTICAPRSMPGRRRRTAGRQARGQGDETAAIIVALDAERDIVAGALVQPLLAGGHAHARRGGRAAWASPRPSSRKSSGASASFAPARLPAPGRGLSGGQADTLRRMLLAVVTDPRLVLVRLADQLRRMRHARDLDDAARLHLAWETREIYAPLANRLGIWQLKWELEDLAFRWLEPAEYRRIAGWLNESRIDRERYIDACDRGDFGRARARRHRGRGRRAGRSTSTASGGRCIARASPSSRCSTCAPCASSPASVEDCYAALGVVHGRWHYIPGEFDDYIATPKDNLYRSLHTAVLGPSAVPVEIQIRTREMHDHAELGVAAHWRYKEGAARDAAYDRKIEWLRELLAPASEAESDSDFLSRVRADLFDDRVYALTPKGEVVDLPSGATPLDFAYHVHTELGHRCRGARVNGRIVPLNHRLANGEVVEIIGGKKPQPSRDWLVEREGLPRLAAQPRQGAGLVQAPGHGREPPRGARDVRARAGAARRRALARLGPHRRVRAHQRGCAARRSRLGRPRARPGGGRDRAAPARQGARRRPAADLPPIGATRKDQAARGRRSRASATCSRRTRAAATRCRRSR